MLNEVSLLWYEVNFTSVLDISHQMLNPVHNLSYLEILQENSEKGHFQCPTCNAKCTKSDCDVISKSYKVFDKACIVEMKCKDGKDGMPKEAKEYMANRKNRCESTEKLEKYEKKLEMRHYLLITAGKCFSCSNR